MNKSFVVRALLARPKLKPRLSEGGSYGGLSCPPSAVATTTEDGRPDSRQSLGRAGTVVQSESYTGGDLISIVSCFLLFSVV